MSEREPEYESRAVGRSAIFSDAVVAIAITLLASASARSYKCWSPPRCWPMLRHMISRQLAPDGRPAAGHDRYSLAVRERDTRFRAVGPVFFATTYAWLLRLAGLLHQLRRRGRAIPECGPSRPAGP